MATKKVTPAAGGKEAYSMDEFDRRRSSDGLLDKAEDLVDQLDNLADLLSVIEEKYSEAEDSEDCEDTDREKRPGLFKRLKDGLESARTLIGCLKREKWRLSRRQLSVELRMGELEDYKSHLKRDMTDMDDTVNLLSMRVIELENSLCESQDERENLDACNKCLEKELVQCDEKRKELEAHNAELLSELKVMRLRRSTSTIQQENNELKSEMEVLVEENHMLKELVREADGLSDHCFHQDQNEASEPEVDLSGVKSEDVDSAPNNLKDQQQLLNETEK